MEIQISTSGSKGAAFYESDGIRLAEMTFSIASESLIIIDHTEVGESLKGQGVGKKLLIAIVEKARKENIKIIPLCPFAKSIFLKNKELQDVLR